MLRARDAASGVIIAEELRLAHTHWTRLKGLLGTRTLDHSCGLWLKPCNQVHMFGMRYAIDVVFLDDAGHTLRLIHGLKPWRISPRVRRATGVLELPAGTITRSGLQVGARIIIEPS